MKKDDDFKDALAEFTARKAANDTNKPVTLEKYERKVEQTLKDIGEFTPAQKEEIMSRVRKTEFFRKLVNEAISDEKILERLKEGLDATKTYKTEDGNIEPVPDFRTRGEYIDRVLKLKGVDTKADDDEGRGMFTINIINPNIET